MAINQVLRKVGQWSVSLRREAPAGLVSGLGPFGHVVVVPGRFDPVDRGQETLTAARYVGVLRAIQRSSGGITLSGVGLESWLGDDDGKGDVHEHPGVTLSGVSFAAAIRALLPPGGSIVEGVFHSGVPGTYTNSHMYQTPRTAIDYVCDTMGGEWRVTPTGALDAGPAAALFRIDPSFVIVRRDAGYDTALKALPGSVDSTRDARGYTTRAVLVAAALAGGTADAVTVPFKDLHGNPVKVTRVIDEQDDTLIANAPARAQAALNATNVIATTTRLSATDFDVAGDFQPGDAVWVWDPEAGVFDTANEVVFRGQVMNPAKVRVVSVTWPVQDGYTVAYRDKDGGWVDLTPWVQWEPAEGGEVEVSDVLTSPLSAQFGSIGTQVAGGGGGAGDTAVPDVPVFGVFTSTTYQPDDGLSRAIVKVPWAQPLNTDGSTIVDGDRYEVRYRPTGTIDWQVVLVAFDQTSATVSNLPPSTGFDWQIRCVDYATPTNYGSWSATTTFATADDTTAPATPAAPTVAASAAAVQVTHTLGLASGGTYNLPLDMDHLEVHVGASAGYTPDATTRVGKIPVNAGMVTGSIPAVGSFDVASTSAIYVKVIAVDRTGNRSTSSSAATATALLWDSAHISDLTVSKLTSGTMTAAVLLAGTIQTAAGLTGGKLDSDGLRAYSPAGVLTTNIDFVTGAATLTGKIQTGTTGSRVVIDPATTDVQFFPTSGSSVAKITGYGADQSGAGPSSTLAWLDARSSTGTGGSYGNLNLSSYASGTFRAGVLLSARQGDGQTSAWVALQDSATDADKGATMGVANEAGAVQGLVSCATGGIILNHVASGNYAGVDADSVTAVADGSYLTVTGSEATLFATGAGNASVQNGNGAYYSANGNHSYINAPGGVYITGAGSTAVSINANGNILQCGQGSDTVYLGQPGSTVAVGAANFQLSNITSATGVNLVHVSRRVYIASSARRFKRDIQSAVIDPADVLALEPVTYIDKSAVEANGGSMDGVRRHYGFVADDYADGPLDMLVHRDDDGEPFSFAYDRVPALHQVVLRDLTARVAALEAAL